MLNIFIIDDEKPAITHLERLLKRHHDIHVTGSYTTPKDALEALKTTECDVIFLDIEMPSLDGREFARRIHSKASPIQIVFVTAYDDYAVEAFSLNAVDYLLKPVSEERLIKTLERLRSHQSSNPSAVALDIKMFGKFSIELSDHTPIKWRTRKTKELMAYLLHHRNDTLSKDKIIETLWPDQPTDKAYRQLYNGIYHIRRTLKNYGIPRSVLTVDKSYNIHLNPSDVACDVGAFLETLEMDDPSLDALQKTLELYNGGYLEHEYYEWSIQEANRLQILFYDMLVRLADKLIEQKSYELAEAYLRRLLTEDPLNEMGVKTSMKLYYHTGNKRKAIQCYAMHKEMMKNELNVSPSKHVEATFKQYFG